LTGNNDGGVNALIGTVGFMLSTLTLSWAKHRWIRRRMSQ